MSHFYTRIERSFDVKLGTGDKLLIKKYCEDNKVDTGVKGDPLRRIQHLINGYQSKKMQNLLRTDSENEKNLAQQYIKRFKKNYTQ